MQGRDLLSGILRVVMAITGAWYIWQFISLVPDRIVYPGELEWMEGGVLVHVLRVLEGEPLYVEPSMEFTPFIYTPLYYWLCAALSSLFGASLSLLRSVSVAAWCGSCVVMACWGFRRHKVWLPGLVGAGLFAATFLIGGAWFDIARADSLLVFLLLLGGFLLFCFDGRRSAIAAGVLMCLAFLTKQSAVLPIVALGVWACCTRDRRLWWFAGTAAGLSMISWLTLHLLSDGWFTYYVFLLPLQHPLLDEWKLLFWTVDVWGILAVPAAILLAYVGASLYSARHGLVAVGPAVLLVAMVLQAWQSRFHFGMYNNVLMPLHAAMGLSCTLALGKLRAGTPALRTLEAVCAIGLLMTFWKLRYPVDEQRPTSTHYAQHYELVRQLAELPPGTWVPYQATPALLAGKTTRAHWMALSDVLEGQDEVAEDLWREALDSLRLQRFPAIVWSFNHERGTWFSRPMRRFYELSADVVGPTPLTGWKQRPTGVWIPRPLIDKDDP